jgi:hypothetical protein
MGHDRSNLTRTGDVLIENKKHSILERHFGDIVLEQPRSFESESTKTEAESIVFALGSIACHTGEQAGALLLITQVLARNHLISAAEAKKLIGLLSADSPEAQRHVNAQCALRRKTKRIRE